MQLCLTKLSVNLEIDPYEFSLDFFNERIITATSNFQGMPALNDSFLQIEEIVRNYANSKQKCTMGTFLFWLSIYWTKNMTFLYNDGLKQTLEL